MEKINVNGMHCKSCEMLIKDALEDQEGVKKVYVSHNNVTVTFDEKIVGIDQLKSIIKKEGYEV
ncbi:MAG: heavy metal-associated domain-containing protein [Nanoarchaeota archaeon]